MKTILGTIAFLARHLDRNDFRAAVKCVLAMLYIPSELAGYTCLLEAVPLYLDDPAQSFTKELYARVGRKLGVDRGQVEKDIRYAIKKAWKRRNEEIWWTFFPQETRPTNGEFIARLAEFLDLWQVCSKPAAPQE